MNIRYGSLAIWPGEPTHDRQWGRFRCDYTDTKRLLAGEVEKLGGTEVLIEGFWRPGDIRQDSQRRADAREPSSPGVVVSFHSHHGGLRYFTDTYADWRHNVRAVALGLEALRAVDRYGITHAAEQYRGFAAIGSGNSGAVNGTPMVFTSRASAEAKLVNLVTQMAPDAPDVHTLDKRTLYRRALILAHPDQGGTRELLEAVQAAGAAMGVA